MNEKVIPCVGVVAMMLLWAGILYIIDAPDLQWIIWVVFGPVISTIILMVVSLPFVPTTPRQPVDPNRNPDSDAFAFSVGYIGFVAVILYLVSFPHNY